MMKIKGTETVSKTVEIDVNPVDAVKSLRQLVYRHLELPIGKDLPYISNGKIYVDEEFHGGSHSSWDTRVLKDGPTKEQLDAILAFGKLNDMVYDAIRNEVK